MPSQSVPSRFVGARHYAAMHSVGARHYAVASHRVVGIKPGTFPLPSMEGLAPNQLDVPAGTCCYAIEPSRGSHKCDMALSVVAT